MSDFELIRDGLLQLDPETRHQTIQAMLLLRKMPPLEAVRVLLQAEARARLREFRLTWAG